MKKVMLFFLIITACSTKSSEETGLIHERVSLEAFKEIIKTKEEIQLVDIRTEGEYKDGYIDAALNIDFLDSNFMDNCNKQLDKSKPVAIYCAGGGRSAKALELFKKEGFVEVYELGVGYSGYK